MENALLTMLGMRRRPNVDRTKIVIPEEMIKLYEEMSGSKLDSINIPKPGLHTQTANTMRGFTHEGKYYQSTYLISVYYSNSFKRLSINQYQESLSSKPKSITKSIPKSKKY